MVCFECSAQHYYHFSLEQLVMAAGMRLSVFQVIDVAELMFQARFLRPPSDQDFIELYWLVNVFKNKLLFFDVDFFYFALHHSDICFVHEIVLQ